MPVDAVCFGADCPIAADVTPPLIEDVKDGADDGSFYFEAKVTDDGSGVASVQLILNGVEYEMTTEKEDIYGVQIPYEPGKDAQWMIMAYDAAGNDAQWVPGLGYIRRGLGLGLGVSMDAFWQMIKKSGWNSVSASFDFERCSGFCGDPVDTNTGNLLEQMQLVSLPGRPDINVTISQAQVADKKSSCFKNDWIAENIGVLGVSSPFIGHSEQEKKRIGEETEIKIGSYTLDSSGVGNIVFGYFVEDLNYPRLPINAIGAVDQAFKPDTFGRLSDCKDDATQIEMGRELYRKTGGDLDEVTSELIQEVAAQYPKIDKDYDCR